MSGVQDAILETPLRALHEALGAKMVPFAGYNMPVQYPTGILAEHKHTRSAAGLFDVSHMGQAILRTLDGSDPAPLLERLVPAELVALPEGRQRYTQLLTETGGIADDLMVAHPASESGLDGLMLVVNAACKDADFKRIRAALGDEASLTILDDRALLALQGPNASRVASEVIDESLATMPFMGWDTINWGTIQLWVTRSGYTGEDGYEISVPADEAMRLAEALLAHDAVAPIGLGARDSLRLEAGLCLYGQDIDGTTSPVEAGLAWSIGKRRKAEGGFPGADRILAELADNPSRHRVGIMPEGRAPARTGTAILAEDGTAIGEVTSGGFGATIGGPIAMGYVVDGHHAPETGIFLEVRGKRLPAKIVPLPFVPARFYRAPK